MSKEETNFGHRLVNRARARRFSNPFAAAGDVLNMIIDLIREYADVDLPTLAEVLKSSAYVYDQFIAPVDIPVVPNLIEPAVDAMLRDVFLKAVESAYQKIVDLTS